MPMSEVQLTTETIRRFRQGYVQSFGAATRDDRLYETVSEGRRYAGLEHWMPLFYDHLDTLFDYLGGVPLVFDPQVEDAAAERISLVQDYYQAREGAMKTPQAGVAPYKPLPPRALYLMPNELKERIAAATVARLTPVRPARTRPSAPSSIAAPSPAATSRRSGPTRTPACSTRRWRISATSRDPVIT